LFLIIFIAEKYLSVVAIETES